MGRRCREGCLKASKSLYTRDTSASGLGIFTEGCAFVLGRDKRARTNLPSWESYLHTVLFILSHLRKGVVMINLDTLVLLLPFHKQVMFID